MPDPLDEILDRYGPRHLIAALVHYTGAVRIPTDLDLPGIPHQVTTTVHAPPPHGTPAYLEIRPAVPST